MSKRILLTGGRTFYALELARLFARQGHEVYLADSVQFPLTRFSNSIAGFILVPEPRFAPREYVSALSNIIVEKRIDVCVPIFEEIFYIAWGIERLTPSCMVWTDTIEKLEVLHNKLTFIEYIKNIGFRTPKTESISSRSKLISCLTRFVCDKVVLKPAYSRFASRAFIWNRGEAVPISIQPTETQPWIAQEFIDGRPVVTWSVAKGDRVLAHSSYISQQQWGIGPSMVFEYLKHPNAQKWVEQFVLKTCFTGQIGFDFIETEDGILYPIECNPRGSSGIHLFKGTPEFVELFLSDKKQQVVISRGDEIRSIKLWLFVRLCRLIFANQPVSKWKETWQCLSRSIDVLYEKGDPFPYVGHMISFAEILFRSMRLRTSPGEVASRDCDYNGIGEIYNSVKLRYLKD